MKIDYSRDSEERKAMIESLANAATERKKIEYRRESEMQLIELVVRADESIEPCQRTLVEGLVIDLMLKRKLERFTGRKALYTEHFLDRRERMNDEIAASFRRSQI